MASGFAASDKDLDNYNVITEFPYEATNRNRETKICDDADELLNHLHCRDKLSVMYCIGYAKVHPNTFLTPDIQRLIKHFGRYKRYGITFLYKDFNECPNIVLDFFDLIQLELDKIENDKIKTQQNQAKAEEQRNKRIAKK